MLIINNEEVEKLLTMADCIRVQEDAFKKIPTGGSIHRPRIDMYMPCQLNRSIITISESTGEPPGSCGANRAPAMRGADLSRVYQYRPNLVPSQGNRVNGLASYWAHPNL